MWLEEGEVEQGQGLLRGSDWRLPLLGTYLGSGGAHAVAWCLNIVTITHSWTYVCQGDLLRLKVCYTEQMYGSSFFFFLTSVMWPCYTSFLKHILSFTKNGYPFSWNTGSLEIYQFEGNHLLASSFFSEGSSGMWCISVPPSVQFSNSKICRFVMQQLAMNNILFSKIWVSVCMCVSVIQR